MIFARAVTSDRRQIRCIAPAVLAPILQQPLPADLAVRAPKSVRVLADLHDPPPSTFSPKDIAILDRVVLRNVALRLSHLPQSVRMAKLGSPLPHTIYDLDVSIRTLNCLRNAGYAREPERLAEATIEDLLAIRNFGATSLIDLLAAIERYRLGSSRDPDREASGREHEAEQGSAAELPVAIPPIMRATTPRQLRCHVSRT